jgi:hypothetical protein
MGVDAARLACLGSSDTIVTWSIWIPARRDVFRLVVSALAQLQLGAIAVHQIADCAAWTTLRVTIARLRIVSLILRITLVVCSMNDEVRKQTNEVCPTSS